MPIIAVESPSPPAVDSPFSQSVSTAALVTLSRNASVISSSSSNSSSSSLLLSQPPSRPGSARIRTFSSPRTRSPSRGPPTPTRTRAPVYLRGELSSEQTPTRGSIQSKSRSNSTGNRLGPDDFEFGQILGEGSYSTVMMAVYTRTRKTYAIKVIDKEPLIRKNLVKVAGIEKNALIKLTGSGHPGVLRLHWAFHDRWSAYFVLDLVSGGDLRSRIHTLGSICLPCARWYMAQIIDTLALIHSKGVVHRDLKPENVLIGDDMRIKLSDYGSAKLFDADKDDDDRSNSWVCTPQYVPPELLIGGVTTASSDFWAAGCILYQMLCGKFPFHGSTNYLMWVKVRNLEYTFPEGIDAQARDLIESLLVLDPESRLGAGKPGSANDLSALRVHPFFDGIDWDRLWTEPVPPLEAGLIKRESLDLERNLEGFDINTEWEKGEVNMGTDDIEEYDVESVPTETDAVSNSPNADDHPIDSPTPKPASLNHRDEEHNPFFTPPFPSSPIETVVASPDNSPPNSPAASRLTGLFDSLSLHSRTRRSSSMSSTSTVLADSGRWMRPLRPSEVPVFSSCVLKAPRKGFSRHFLSTKPRDNKGKVRLLVLTKTRLLCLKEEDGDVVLNDELLIGGQCSNDSHGVVTGVEKVDDGFVVQTASRSYTYATEDTALAVRWTQEISDALPVKKSPSLITTAAGANPPPKRRRRSRTSLST